MKASLTVAGLVAAGAVATLAGLAWYALRIWREIFG